MPTDFHTAKNASVKWSDSGADEVLSFASLAAGGGRNGALHDFGVMPRPTRYHITAKIAWDTAAVIGETLRIFIREAGGVDDATATNPTNDDGTGDTALGASKERNLLHVGTIVADEAAADIPSVFEGEFVSSSRFKGPTVINDSAANILDATATNSFITITPIFDQAQ